MNRLPRPDTELLGRTLGGRYAVRSLLGSGGMGAVYEAVDLVGAVPVAIKGLNRRSFTPANLRRLRFEAEIASTLVHEHICRVHGIGVDGGAPYLVMERLEGETLRSLLRREGALGPADAIAIMLQVLDALSVAHAARIIHRDVKPSNIFLTRVSGSASPHVKLIDFGLAKAVGSSGDGDVEEITALNEIAGTPQYLTPEQLLGERNLDARVDVWAAALTLFEMLTGRRAQATALVPEALAERILREPVPSIATERRDLPREIDDVLQHALAKDRRRRFSSAAAFRTALVAVWARHRAGSIARGRSMYRAPPAPRSGWMKVAVSGRTVPTMSGRRPPGSGENPRK